MKHEELDVIINSMSTSYSFNTYDKISNKESFTYRDVTFTYKDDEYQIKYKDILIKDVHHFFEFDISSFRTGVYANTYYSWEKIIKSQSLDMLVKRLEYYSDIPDLVWLYDINYDVMSCMDIDDIDDCIEMIKLKLPFIIKDGDDVIQLQGNTINGKFIIYKPTDFITKDDRKNIELYKIMKLT